jgi:hypothetical protein
MAAALVRQEELAVTAKSAVFKTNMVVIIITVESHIKLIKAEALTILGIAMGFFNLSDHAIIHFLLSFSREMKKARRQARAFQKFVAGYVR